MIRHPEESRTRDLTDSEGVRATIVSICSSTVRFVDLVDGLYLASEIGRGMRKSSGAFLSLAIAVVCLAGSGYVNARAAQNPTRAASSAPSAAPAGDIINKYCLGCHNARLKTAGLTLDQLDLQHVGDNAQQWEKVVTKLRTGEMPPPGRPRPDAAS